MSNRRETSVPLNVRVKFEAAANMYQHWSYRPLYEELACSTLGSGATVVSVGEGTGEYLLALAQRFPRLHFIGFDLDPARIATAEELRQSLGIVNARFGIADALSLPLPDNAADFVYSRVVFHIVPNKDGFLREIKRIAAAGIHLSMIRNNPQASLLIRYLVAKNAIRGGIPYSKGINDARITEEWLWKIGSYHSLLWYRTLIRRHFPNARMVGTHRLWIDTGRPVSLLTALFSQSIGFVIEVSSPTMRL